MAFIPEYILILALTIAVDYWAAIFIERSGKRRARGRYLWASVSVTCLILFFFKYLDFVWQAGNDVREWLGVNVTQDERRKFGFFLPIGLSFHTFQSLSYVIEVYRGRQRAERHFGIYALYVLFFPQLVAGPIERPQHLLEQFRKRVTFDVGRVSSGLRLMLWGMFQKTVVADRLALAVDYVYSSLGQAPPDAIFLASVFFALQIYADFQGYTQIARGAARVLGFELVRNFDRPYAALSVSEFWRRWHMSLSSWLRDYVYFPLGGNRLGRARGLVNLMLTFVISGLWHGANWTFVVWGALNGAAVAAERFFKVSGTSWKPLRWAYTFAAVLVAWVFFRAATLVEALAAVQRLPEGALRLAGRVWEGSILGSEFLRACGVEVQDLILAVAALAAMEGLQWLERPDMGEVLRARPWAWRWAAYVAFLGAVLYSWMYFPQSQKPFIYFQF